jgi:hypothetical protein
MVIGVFALFVPGCASDPLFIDTQSDFSAPPDMAIAPPDMTSAPPDMTITPEEFAIEFRRLECDYEVRCGFIAASQRARCLSPNWDFCTVGYSFPDALAAGRVRFDPALAGCILEQARTHTCALREDWAWQSCRPGIGYWNICGSQAPYFGLVPDGGACLVDVECAGGNCNPTIANGCKGVCGAFLPAGADCVGGSKCEPGTTCESNPCASTPPLKFTCWPLSVGAGGACDDCDPTKQCRPGLSCVGAQDYTTCKVRSGTCLIGALGERCTKQQVFGSGTCAAGLQCDDIQNPSVCAPRLGAGASCDSSYDCTDELGCMGVHFAEDSCGQLVTARGTCTPWRDVGQPCDPKGEDWNNGCAFLLFCDPTSGVCSDGAALGGDCSISGSDFRCSEGYCASPGLRCEPQSPLGGACNPSDVLTSCSEGWCSLKTSTCVLSPCD